METTGQTFLSAQSLVRPNVRIGADVVVGSGSVVTRDVPDGTVVAGNPARKICTIAEYHEKIKTKRSTVPCFGQEYRLKRGSTVAMCQSMRERMPEKEAFIVFEGASQGLKPEL